MPKLSVNLVVCNGARYLPYLFDALKKQTFKDWDLIFIDNGSTDGTLKEFEKLVSDTQIPHRIIQNQKNVGFSAGHNIAYAETTASYVLMLNVDIYPLPQVFERLINFMDEQKNSAAASVRLMRWNFERSESMLASGMSVFDAAREGFTTQIDAIGIRLFRNRRALEWLTRYEWTKDSESLSVQEIYGKEVVEVFGVSGTIPMYRKNITDQILLPEGKIFDPTYHSYKEDLDLAYRLRDAGYTSYIILNTVAYHDRTSAGPKKKGSWAALKNKKSQSEFVIMHSYENHLRTLYKNEYWQNFLLDFPLIMSFELKKFVFLLFTRPLSLAKAIGRIIKEFPYTCNARKSILSTRKMYWKGIRRWF
jgi:GT2 family glycosyltransferase